jgi:hypothetical protein
MKVTIDPEFKSFLRPLAAEEYDRLRKDIEKNGVKDQPVAWAQKDGPPILMDGHNRYDICKELGKKFPEPRVLKLPSREAALEWMSEHQLGRRNLTEVEVKYYRGKEYLESKKPEGRPKLGENPPVNGEGLVTEPKRTSEKIAAKHGVNEKTIRQDAKLAKEIDQLPDDEKKKVLAGKQKAPKVQKKAASSNGRVAFNRQKFEDMLGNIAKGIEQCAQHYSSKGEEWKAIRLTLEVLLADWKRWTKVLK